MRAGKLRMKARLCRWGGYFCFVATVLWFQAREGPSVWERFQAEHGWPSASSTVAGFEEHSRTGFAKKHGFAIPLYWTEFSVLLQLPMERCPAPMRRPFKGVMQCVGNYTTNWTDDANDTFRWRHRHRLLSQVAVYYDPTGRSADVVFASEAVGDRYPWGDIARGMFILLLGIVCSAIARSDVEKADAWEAKYPDEREDLSSGEPRETPAWDSDDGELLQLKLSARE